MAKLQKSTSRFYKAQGNFMKDNILNHIKKLVEKKKIDEAEFELSKLGATFYKNSE